MQDWRCVAGAQLLLTAEAVVVDSQLRGSSQDGVAGRECSSLMIFVVTDSYGLDTEIADATAGHRRGKEKQLPTETDHTGAT